MFSGGLLDHFKRHPDEAKSEEAIQVAGRMREWRDRNLMPGLRPTWKSSPTGRSKQRPMKQLPNADDQGESLPPAELDGDMS